MRDLAFVVLTLLVGFMGYAAGRADERDKYGHTPLDDFDPNREPIIARHIRDSAERERRRRGD